MELSLGHDVRNIRKRPFDMVASAVGLWGDLSSDEKVTAFFYLTKLLCLNSLKLGQRTVHLSYANN